MPRPYNLTYNEGRYGNERFGFGDTGGDQPDPGTNVYAQLTGNYTLPSTGSYGTPDVLSSADMFSLSMQSFFMNYGPLLLGVGAGLVVLNMVTSTPKRYGR